jgi:hypothetical protein
MREYKNFNQKPENRLRLVIIGFLLSTFIIIATTPIHEGAHWIMSEIDPYVEPVEIHVFDDTSYKSEKNVLPSALGSVVIKEKYPGAFNDRPAWANVFQEIVCISIQIFLAVFITLRILTWMTKRNITVTFSVNQN